MRGMTIGSPDEEAFDALELRLRTILPEEYQDCYDDLEPVSMGSAGLKYGRDGKVAWNDIWSTFCDLAMAGGPPHKGALLEPGSRAAVYAEPERYRQVVDEICRGVTMVTDLAAEPSPVPGWVLVDCETSGMAEWLVRAIVMENVSARCKGALLELPAGPGYRVEKEIKNVITVIAKTCHYWLEHMWATQRRDIANLFATMAAESPLVQPAFAEDDYDDFSADRHNALCTKMSETIHRLTGLRPSNHRYAGWLGLECPNVRAAGWMMRALVAVNVLARREETTLFVPVNPATDSDGGSVVKSVIRIHGLASARGILDVSKP
jgi:sirohydrochlorin cobaltochelatase